MRVFFAAAENTHHREKNLMPMQCDNLLFSFFYMRKWKPRRIHETMKLARSTGQKLFLDSWAHTIIVAFGSHHWNKSHFDNNYNKTLVLSEFVKDYFQFIAIYGKYFDYIAELDIAWCSNITYDDIKNRRQIMLKLWLEDKMIVVWHRQIWSSIWMDWKKERKRLCENYKFLAIWDAPDWELLKDHFSIWKKVWNMNKIHWFAETKMSKMMSYPFYSVDSTTRMCGTVYWYWYVRDDENKAVKQLAYKRKDHIEKYFKHIPERFRNLKYIIDWHGRQSWYTRNIINILAREQAEKYCTEVRTERGYTFID